MSEADISSRREGKRGLQSLFPLVFSLFSSSSSSFVSRADPVAAKGVYKAGRDVERRKEAEERGRVPDLFTYIHTWELSS